MKVGIVGSGFVGSTAAYAMVMNGVGRDIVLVDQNQARAAAEANDIFHAVPFSHPLHVRAGTYTDLHGCQVVILTAGVNQKPGETRLQLLARNAAIFNQIVPQVIQNAPGATLLVATNPVDVMTHLTAEIAVRFGLPRGRVVGSGTTLDTARFRTLLGNLAGVDSRHVHGYVIGEHGDSEVLTWSNATVAGMPIEDYCNLQGQPLTDEIRLEIDSQVRRAAYSIIAGKGATYYGIEAALARITRVILRSIERSILTVCGFHDDIEGVKHVTLAVPHLVGGEGILARFPIPLDDAERSALKKSAEVLKPNIESAVAALNS
ncbi:MAG: L-lactate dehydrogenase [Planctomycetales bacterium]